MRPIWLRQQIDVLNGDPDQGIPTLVELQLCGPSDSEVPLADQPIVIVYSADDDPYLGDELRLPLTALKEFIESSAELVRSITSPPSTHTSDGSPESTENGGES